MKNIPIFFGSAFSQDLPNLVMLDQKGAEPGFTLANKYYGSG